MVAASPICDYVPLRADRREFVTIHIKSTVMAGTPRAGRRLIHEACFYLSAIDTGLRSLPVPRFAAN